MTDKILDDIEGLKTAIRANPEAAERLGPQLREIMSSAKLELDRLVGPGGVAGYCHSHCGSHCHSHGSERFGMMGRLARR
ncbi:MAG: hypothetical protein AAF577_04700 [Pseudomonadota bacterium]